jgi:hypothetical protein
MMTAEQRIKSFILSQAIEDGTIKNLNVQEDYSENIDDIFEEQNENWQLQDLMMEFRESGEQTKIPCDYSRHYESYSVARKLGDVWVGWTYWFGGGKHAEPEAIDWMNEAYFLDVTEEQKVVTVYTYKKVE